MKAFNCHCAMVVTNRSLTKAAREYAERTGCVVVDRAVLGQWISRFRGDTPSAVTSNAEALARLNPYTKEEEDAAWAKAVAARRAAEKQVADAAELAEFRRQAREAATRPKVAPLLAEESLDGLPAHVMKKIRGEAAQRHPRDASAQHAWTDTQARAWLQLHTFEPASVPAATVRGIAQ